MSKNNKKRKKALVVPRKDVEASKVLSTTEIQARIPIAQTTQDNTYIWGDVDSYSADTAYSHQVRKTIRERARFEVNANSYMDGIIDTYSNDVVSTTPKLQVLTKNKNFNKRFERDFSSWSKEIRLGQKLRTAVKGRVTDGEAFGEIVTNPKLKNPIKLDLSLVECDRVAHPISDYSSLTMDNKDIDGVVLDDFGNVQYYVVMEEHPGNAATYNQNSTKTPEEYMLHFYRPSRPEQHRGISEIAPSLSLFAQLRRYTEAVIAAAETAADFAAVIQSDVVPEEAANLQPLDLVQLEKRMATVLPQGWSIGQIRAEQPTTGYKDFKQAIIAEIARCLGMPYNIAAGDSSGHNFSSAKLDVRMYEKELKIQQYDMEPHLDKLLRHYKAEWSKINNIDVEDMPYKWMWVTLEPTEQKEINAIISKLQNGMLTYEDYYSSKGEDWESQFEQIAQERSRMAELGLVFGDTSKTVEPEPEEPEPEEPDLEQPGDEA